MPVFDKPNYVHFLAIDTKNLFAIYVVHYHIPHLFIMLFDNKSADNALMQYVMLSRKIKTLAVGIPFAQYFTNT